MSNLDLPGNDRLLYGDLTNIPVVVHLREVDGRVSAVIPVTDTPRHTRRQTAVVNATQCARGVLPGGWTERRLLESDHYHEVDVGAHETTTGDSDRERRLQLVRDLCLDDDSREPAYVSRRWTPAVRGRGVSVHVRRRQGQTRVGVIIIETPHQFHVDWRVKIGMNWNRWNQFTTVSVNRLYIKVKRLFTETVLIRTTRCRIKAAKLTSDLYGYDKTQITWYL